MSASLSARALWRISALSSGRNSKEPKKFSGGCLPDAQGIGLRFLSNLATLIEIRG